MRLRPVASAQESGRGKARTHSLRGLPGQPAVYPAGPCYQPMVAPARPVPLIGADAHAAVKRECAATIAQQAAGDDACRGEPYGIGVVEAAPLLKF